MVEEINLIILKESNPVLANIYLTAFDTGMRSLLYDQIIAELKVSSEGGTSYQIRFLNN